MCWMVWPVIPVMTDTQKIDSQTQVKNLAAFARYTTHERYNIDNFFSMETLQPSHQNKVTMANKKHFPTFLGINCK